MHQPAVNYILENLISQGCNSCLRTVITLDVRFAEFEEINIKQSYQAWAKYSNTPSYYYHRVRRRHLAIISSVRDHRDKIRVAEIAGRA